MLGCSRGWRYRHRRLCLLVLLQYLRQLIDVCLEELELLLARLTGRHNLHDGLQLWIGAGPRREHVDNRIGGWCRRWPRRRLWRGLLDRLGGRRSRLRRLFRRVRRLVVLLVRRRMLAVLAVVRPGAILLWRRHLLGRGSAALLWRIQLDGERVRLDDQLCVQRADLGEVLLNLLLPRLAGLVCVGALGDLLGHGVLLVEGAEVDARHPHGARALQRGAEDAALLDVLPFRGRELERLRVGERGQRLALDDPERQRLLGGLLRCLADGRAWCRLLDGDAGAFALQRRLGALRRLLAGGLGRRRRSFFAGARPRRSSRLRHGG